MEEIGAFEAKTHFSKLLKKVAAGESFAITKHGLEVACLVPAHPKPSGETHKTIEKLRNFRRGNRLGKLTLQEMKETGRR